jgi:ACS family tartrate transporter-like MFS transporter
MNPDQQSQTIRTVTLRLMPILLLSYFIAYVDRINIGFAATALSKSLGLSHAVFGFGAGLFFIGYFLFEVPSNLLLARIGARRWISRIMVTWGLLSACMIFVRGEYSFYALRFLIGVAEAGFFPGVVYYIVCWFPNNYRARLMALFSVSIPLSSVIGAPLSSALLSMDGFWGLAGWDWMFLIEGLPAVLVGLVIFLMLPDRPREASFLSAAQKDWLENELETEKRAAPPPRPGNPLWIFLDPAVLALCAIYFANVSANLALAFFLPTIIGHMGLTQMQTGLLTAVPAAVGVAGLVLFGWLSDRYQDRRGALLAAVLFTLAGLVLAARFGAGGASFIGIAALSIAAIGIHGLKSPFWAIAPLVLGPMAAAGGIAWINAVGNLGGFVGPWVIGWLIDHFGTYTAAIYALAAMQAVAVVLVFLVQRPGRPKAVLEQVLRA